MFTVNPLVNVAVPPPGAALVTLTFRAPVAAVAPIVIFVLIVELLNNTVELIVIFAPKSTELTPLMKFVPTTKTSKVWDRFPLFGVRLVIVGAGLFTVNPLVKVAVPPPGAKLVTVTSPAPVATFE